MMEQSIRAALKTALPGIPVEFGVLPSDMSLPAIVLDTVAETASFSHAGESDLHDHVVQVDCYAETYAGAGALWRQVHEVLQPPLAFLEIKRRGREGGKDEAVRPYRVSADYRIFHAI